MAIWVVQRGAQRKLLCRDAALSVRRTHGTTPSVAFTVTAQDGRSWTFSADGDQAQTILEALKSARPQPSVAQPRKHVGTIETLASYPGINFYCETCEPGTPPHHTRKSKLEMQAYAEADPGLHVDDFLSRVRCPAGHRGKMSIRVEAECPGSGMVGYKGSAAPTQKGED